MKSKFHFSLLILVLSMLFSVRPVEAQSGISLENVVAAIQFGEQISFAATIKASIAIQDVSIVILDETQAVTYVQSLVVEPDGRTEFRYDTRKHGLRPFTVVRWNYRFTMPDGTLQHSEVFSTRYEDDRFEWQTLESGMLRVHWYVGDSDFGQAALDAVQSGLVSVSRLVPTDLSEPVEFYIYENMRDLHGTLAPGSQNWIAGHADPALGVVMVTVEPSQDQNTTMGQRLPHELMHVMLYRAAGSGYANIPAWLKEGMSALAEVIPNGEYDRVLAKSVARTDWIPLLHLCGSFPADTGRAYLAYAESRSFVGYLYETYGSAGLLTLAQAYSSGADCERGPELAFDVPLSKLELDWHASVLGQKVLDPALQNMIPYLVMLLLVLIVPVIGIFGSMRSNGSHHE